MSEYFSKGDVVLVRYELNSSIFTEQFHVFNIDDVSKGMLLIDNRGALFPVQAEVASIKVLKSGFKNMQSTDVGSLVFKSMDPTVLSNLSAGTATTPSDLKLTNGNWNNHIINASAVEYSNDWQVFCGPDTSGKEECICSITPEGYAFLGMLQNLNSQGLLLSKNVEVYDVITHQFSNGFSNVLLSSSQKLINFSTGPISPMIGDHTFTYTGKIAGSTLNIAIG